MKYLWVCFRNVVWIVNVFLLLVFIGFSSISFFTGIFLKFDVSHNVQSVKSDHYTYERLYLKVRFRSGGMQIAITPHMPALPRTSHPDWLECSGECQREMTYPIDVAVPKKWSLPNSDGSEIVSVIKVGKIPGHQYINYFYFQQKNGVPTSGATTVCWSVTFHTATVGLPWFLITGYLWIRHQRKQERKKMGLCRSCAYDLSGSPNRCPECGRRPA